MATIDQKTVLKPIPAFDSTTITSDTTTNGIIIDTLGFEAVTIVLQSGTIAAGVATPAFVQGDDSGLADGTAVVADDLLGTIADATFAATDDDDVKWIGYRGKKRFLRLDIVTTGTTTSTVLAAIAVFGTPHKAPTV